MAYNGEKIYLKFLEHTGKKINITEEIDSLIKDVCVNQVVDILGDKLNMPADIYSITEAQLLLMKGLVRNGTVEKQMKNSEILQSLGEDVSIIEAFINDAADQILDCDLGTYRLAMGFEAFKEKTILIRLGVSIENVQEMSEGSITISQLFEKQPNVFFEPGIK